MENLEKLDVSVILPIDSANNIMFEDLFNRAITSIQTHAARHLCEAETRIEIFLAGC